MSTQKQDTAQFQPGGMEAYKGITGALGNVLPGFIQNPFGSPQFGLEQQMGTSRAQQLGGTGMSGLLRNMTASGMAGGASSPAGLEMQQNQARANTGLQSQLGFLAPYMAALQRQQSAMGMGSQFRPLQTGQTESTSGLGTWLPQVAQFGLSALMGMPGGGGGPFGGAGGQGPSSLPTMAPWAGGGQGAFGEGGGTFNLGGLPGQGASGFGGLPQPPNPYTGF